MRVDKNAQVAGVPMPEVRAMLKYAARWHGELWRGGAAFVLKDEDESRVDVLLEALEKEGFIEPVGTGERAHWQLSLKGSALAQASFAKPISRATAERAVDEILERIRELNENPYYLYRVDCALVFGSYITDRTDLGDVDIALALVPKEPNWQQHRNLMDERTSEALRGGRKFGNMVAELFWAHTECRLFLKARSRILSIHDGDQTFTIAAKALELFPNDMTRGFTAETMPTPEQAQRALVCGVEWALRECVVGDVEVHFRSGHKIQLTLAQPRGPERELSASYTGVDAYARLRIAADTTTNEHGDIDVRFSDGVAITVPAGYEPPILEDEKHDGIVWAPSLL